MRRDGAAAAARGRRTVWADLRTRSDEDLRPSGRFLEKNFEPIGACSGYSRASLCLPGHLIPATFFNDFSSLPATYFLELFKFLFIPLSAGRRTNIRPHRHVALGR